MPAQPYLYERLQEDDPNYEIVRRNLLSAWADSYGLEADAHGGRLTLSGYVEGWIRSFRQGAQTFVELQDPSTSARCAELDVLAEEGLRLFSESLLPESERLGEAEVMDAIQEFSRQINEITALSKQRICEAELGRSAEPQPCDSGAGIAPADRLPSQGNTGVECEASSESSVSRASTLSQSVVAHHPEALTAVKQDKGNLALLEGLDDKLKRAVTVDVARRFGGVSRRAIEDAAKKGSLQTEGTRLQRKVLVESLLKYFPPEK